MSLIKRLCGVDMGSPLGQCVHVSSGGKAFPRWFDASAGDTLAKMPRTEATAVFLTTPSLTFTMELLWITKFLLSASKSLKME